MSYDVAFKVKIKSRRNNQWLYVGDDWINHTSNTSDMIKEVCGSRPPEWGGRSCKEMYPILMQGISLLTIFPQKYRAFEPVNGWGTVETTTAFLEKIAANCEQYPDAVLEVNY